jgi:peroxidase
MRPGEDVAMDGDRMRADMMRAGDDRANSNLMILAMHTLFAREHNRLCDELAARHPTWSDEDLYQHARYY